MLIPLLAIIFIPNIFAGNCSWERCNLWSKDKNVINVHLIPHTHDDLGWIKTVDQYYYGSKPDLVPVGVQYIYNTVIDELEKNPERKFSFAETGFLMRWMSSHGDADRHRLQKLVKNGQIELIGGGWVQNDEAASHYVDIVDQMTLGLHKLETIFGECGKPRTAWQIDPFGHSRELANLFAMMGYESLYFARIHYVEKQMRLQNKTLEFIWNASDDLKTQILTGAFFQDNYGPPPGFCWDAMCGDDPMQDNPELEEYNIDQKIDAFVKHVRNQSAHQRTNHVMLLMGSDFQYTNANMWYENLDKLIKYVMANSSLNVNVFYSTPTCYTNAVTQAQPHLTTKSDDFFPYASSEHSYWTGYFTSRPTFKGMIREASSMLQLAKQLDSQFFLGPSDDSDVEILSKACALAQHHDAVTGTAKENVTRDYEKRLAKGMREVEYVINDALSKSASNYEANKLPKNEICLTLNETVCQPIKSFPTFTMTVFNARGQNESNVVKIPFYSRTALVVDGSGTKVPSQLVKTFQIPPLSSDERAPFELHIPVEVGPLGYTTYFVDNSSSVRSSPVQHPTKIKGKSNEVVQIENEQLVLTFDAAGYISNVKTKSDDKTYPLRQEFFYYEGANGTSKQPSGAYIFRPTSQDATPLGNSVKLEVVKGPLVQEVRQVISPWVYQTIRLSKNDRHIEFDWVIGPIPKEEKDPITKEIVTSYYSDVSSNGVFYTDSNGRQMMKRKLNSNPSFTYKDTEPVSGNYYPITNRFLVKDASHQLTLLTDRAQGATITKNGAIEVMLHRRCFADDHWGVEEALDEPGRDGKGLVARGKHWLILSPSKDAANIHRPLASRMFNTPVISFAPVSNITDYKTNFKTTFSGLTRPLPHFVNLLTLQKRSGTDLLLRLEHIFQNEEDENHSKPLSVDLKDLFTQFNIKNIHELTLAGNRNFTSTAGRSDRYKDEFLIVLKPQEIRTYLLSVDEKNKSYL